MSGFGFDVLDADGKIHELWNLVFRFSDRGNVGSASHVPVCSKGGGGRMIYSENILVCMAVPLLLTLFFVKDNARQFVLNFLLGMAACLLGAYVSGFLDVATGMGVEDTAVFISPFTEEAMKFLPLLFYFLMFEPQDDRLFHAAVGIGAGFASGREILDFFNAFEEKQ